MIQKQNVEEEDTEDREKRRRTREDTEGEELIERGRGGHLSKVLLEIFPTIVHSTHLVLGEVEESTGRTKRLR